MTKRIFITTILFSLLQLCKGSNDLNIIRETFFKASYDENSYIKLKEIISKADFKDPILEHAYRCAINILTAKYETKLWSKSEEIKTNSLLIDKIIKNSPKNIELHFLRFSLEWHIPFYIFINRHDSIDKRFIIDNITDVTNLNLSSTFKELLYDFLLKTKEFEQMELNIIQENLFHTTKHQK